MSCFSRLLGLICALVPGVLFLAFSVRFFQLWPELGYITGPIYSLLSFITGLVCLYLGVSILFGRDQPQPEENATTNNAAPQMPVASESLAPEPVEPAPLRAAPLPVIEAPAPSEPATPATPATQSIFAATDEAAVDTPDMAKPVAAAPVDTPEARIRQLASTRPQWQVTAPQLAQLSNLNMAVADATARAMVGRGEAQLQTGPNGETIYIFDLAK